MNDFEAKREARIDRLRARAVKMRRVAEARFNSSNIETVRGLDGQPVLVGHHSEKRHRRLLERADNDMRAGIEATKHAAELEDRAAAAEDNTAIFSDDPEALVKLREKLADESRIHEELKLANRLWRKRDREGLRKLVSSDAAVDKILASTEKPVDSYVFANRNANMRRIKLRIAEMERERDRVPAEALEGDGWKIEEMPDDNRIWVTFRGKPPKATSLAMRAAGFRWSPNRPGKPWVRHLNASGRYAATTIANRLASGELSV